MEDAVTKVIVVDSHPIVREGLKQFLEADGSCAVVSQAGDVSSALRSCQENEHNVLLSNAVLPGCDIFDFIRKLKSSSDSTKVVVCYIDEDSRLLNEFRNCGTDGYIGQLASSGEYSAAVHTVMHDANFFSQNLTSLLFGENLVSREKTNVYGLTSREIDILSLLSNGLCNKEIATQFDLSVRTVETHRLNIRRKTNSNTLSDLVRIARSIGISGLGNSIATSKLAG